MNKNALIAGLAAVAVAGGIGVYALLFEDMTGATMAEIRAFQQENPNVHITYRVPVDDTMTLHHNTKTIKLTSADQIKPLVEAAEFLQSVQTIQFGELPVNGSQYAALTTAFPNAVLEYSAVTILGKDYPLDTTKLDLSTLALPDAEEVSLALQALPNLTDVDLTGKKELSEVPLEVVAYLSKNAPDLNYNYTFELFGQTLSTEMERVEYFKADIGDEGLEQFRAVLPIMHKLNYLRLDWCGTSNEATAQLREDFKDQCKVVWRVFFGRDYNCLTDTYKIWACWTLNDKNIDGIQYCTEVRYLDLGHNQLTNCEFCRNMPELQVCILSINPMESLEPLRNCTKLEFLEFYMSRIKDLEPISQLTSLRYLHVGWIRTDDFTPLYNLKGLRKLLSVMNNIPADLAAECKAALPDTNVIIVDEGDCVWDYQWRQGKETPDSPYGWMPRYALLREQIGYSTNDESRYPGGYLDHEVTYESTGIAPPINNA